MEKERADGGQEEGICPSSDILYPAVPDRDAEGSPILSHFSSIVTDVCNCTNSREGNAKVTFLARQFFFTIIHLSFAFGVKLNLPAVTNTGKNTDGRIGKYDVSREHGN